jgi:glycosyltransferase involved in cell wall biosynthesis
LKKIYPSISLRIAAALPRLSAQKSLVDHLKDDGYAAYLRHLIKKLGVSDNVVLLPSLRAEEVAEELATAHLFCLPSLCENSPNSLGEAMLVGTPAIATYVGGVPSMLKHMEEALLCPSADEAALAAAIVTLFENDDLAETLASNAREVALQRHDGKRNAKETLNVYHKIMKRCNEF